MLFVRKKCPKRNHCLFLRKRYCTVKVKWFLAYFISTEEDPLFREKWRYYNKKHFGTSIQFCESTKLLGYEKK